MESVEKQSRTRFVVVGHIQSAVVGHIQSAVVECTRSVAVEHSLLAESTTVVAAAGSPVDIGVGYQSAEHTTERLDRSCYTSFSLVQNNWWPADI